jgi:vacuolar-type H+-ATPase subunit C/Vma6
LSGSLGRADSAAAIARLADGGDGDEGKGTGKVAPFFKSDLEALAAAADLTALGTVLRARGFLLSEDATTADAIELAVRRTAAARLRLLARWAGARNPLLAVVFEDEDRRSLRAIMRGAVQGAATDQRLAGLVPTPSLPERALVALAGQPTPRAVAALLTAWGNAYGSALLEETAGTQPDLLEIEQRLNRVFAERALRGARRARSRLLLNYVRELIDLENACAALVLASGETDIPAKRAFIEGGRYVALDGFLESIATADAGAAGRRLAVALRPAGLGLAFERWAGDAAEIEQRVLLYRIAALHAAERRDPAGPASVLGFVLRLRKEALELRRLIWGVVLGTPLGDRVGAIVSA